MQEKTRNVIFTQEFLEVVFVSLYVICYRWSYVYKKRFLEPYCFIVSLCPI